ncbi:META domain-containing protein [Marinomonas algarum]|uniref:META domain-containing protein n=1 Tax=Marinomonas algarum TaxID=2883105 RepID=A0A9X1IQK6_9GAMM|nr:META domain-containing protein [Marinomonas algarum]MCB5162143.1 META domain-containing protein [Marinomonas algarum]
MDKRALVICLSVAGMALFGCQSQQQATDATLHTPDLQGNWQVEDIDAGGVIDFSQLTVQFPQESRISGYTGCNQYTAALEQNGNQLTVLQPASTRRLCAEAISMQEQRFLAALNAAAKFQQHPNGSLTIFDASGDQRLTLMPITSNVKQADGE